MNSMDWLAVSNYVLAGVAVALGVEMYLVYGRTNDRLSEVERKLDLVLGYDVEEEDARPPTEERGVETAARDPLDEPGA